MAREVKAGKKFIYGLETVLKVRNIREKREKEKFVTRQKEYYDEKMKEQQIENEKRTQAETLKDMVKKGEISSFPKVLARREHLNILKDQLDMQIEKVVEASQNLEQQREKLLESMKERQIIERDKDNKRKIYNELMKKLEIGFLDEIATLRFGRKKLEQG